MCACVISTAFSERGSKGGACQLRSRSSLKPWNRPQSTNTRESPDSTRYFDPVTVPTPPQNEMLANADNLPSVNRRVLRRQSDDLLRGVLHSGRDGEIQTRLSDDALSFFDVGPFEPHDDRHFDLEISRSFNN